MPRRREHRFIDAELPVRPAAHRSLQEARTPLQVGSVPADRSLAGGPLAGAWGPLTGIAAGAVEAAAAGRLARKAAAEFVARSGRALELVAGLKRAREEERGAVAAAAPAPAHVERRRDDSGPVNNVVTPEWARGGAAGRRRAKK